jgi:hypothetical protein
MLKYNSKSIHKGQSVDTSFDLGSSTSNIPISLSPVKMRKPHFDMIQEKIGKY